MGQVNPCAPVSPHLTALLREFQGVFSAGVCLGMHFRRSGLDRCFDEASCFTNQSALTGGEMQSWVTEVPAVGVCRGIPSGTTITIENPRRGEPATGFIRVLLGTLSLCPLQTH